MSITMKEIAKLAGVSHQAVSAVLNNNYKNSRVSHANREKILGIARDNNYFPNPLAQMLKTGRTGNINVIIPSALFLLQPQYAQVLSGLQAVLHDNGYKFDFTIHAYDDNDTSSLARIAADGIIMFYWSGWQDTMLEQVRAMDLPLVAAAGHCTLPGIHNLYFDSAAAMKELVRILAEKGHRRIGYAPSFPGDVYVIEAAAAIKETIKATGGAAFKQFDVRSRAGTSASQPELFRAGYDSFEKVYADPFRPSVVIFTNDYAALGAVRRAEEMGLSIPGDIALFGNGNDPAGCIARPALSTMDMRAVDFGCRLGGMMKDVVDAPGTPCRKEAFVVTPCFRETA